MTNVIYLTISTGIAVVILDGEVYRARMAAV